jgi:DNA-binding phage protein
MSERVHIPRERLASYESGRVLVPYYVGSVVCQVLSVNQRWLAEGKLPMAYCAPVQFSYYKSHDGRMLFSEAYERFLKGPVEAYLKDLQNLTGMDVSQMGETLNPADKFDVTENPHLSNLFGAIDFMVKKTAVSVPAELFPAYYKALRNADEEFFVSHQGEISALSAKKSFDELYVTSSLHSVMNQASLWEQLLARLEKLTAKRGAKAKLARDLGLTQQAVTKWFSRTGEPSAEVVLKLLEWIKKAEV